MSNVMLDSADEDDFDDPIRLFENEQSRVCYTELKNIHIEDPGNKVDITEGENKTLEEISSSFRKKTFLLPISFFDNEKNIELLSECRPLRINIVDCMKSLPLRGNKNKDYKQDIDRKESKKQVINSRYDNEYEGKRMTKNDIDKYRRIMIAKMAAFYHKKFDKVTKHMTQNETVDTLSQFPLPAKVNKNVFGTTSTLNLQEHCNKTICTSNGEIIPHVCDTDTKFKLKGDLDTLNKKNNFANSDIKKIAPLLNQKSQSYSDQTFHVESVINNRNSPYYNQHLTGKMNKSLKIYPVNNVTSYLNPKVGDDIREMQKRAPYFCPTTYSNLVNLLEKPTISKSNNQQKPYLIKKQEMLLNTKSSTAQKNHTQNLNNLMYVPNSNNPNANASSTIKSDTQNMYKIVDDFTRMAKAIDYSITGKILECNENTDGRNVLNNNLNITHNSYKSNQNQSINNNKASVIVPNFSVANTNANNNQKAANKESYNINKQNCIRNSECRKTMDTTKKQDNTNKAYSPPILPIPSYENVFKVISKIKFFYFEGDKMFINADSDNNEDVPVKNLPQQPIIKPSSNKRKLTSDQEKVPRKITINEYKERVNNASKHVVQS